MGGRAPGAASAREPPNPPRGSCSFDAASARSADWNVPRQHRYELVLRLGRERRRRRANAGRRSRWRSRDERRKGLRYGTTNELLPGSDASGSIDDALERDPNLVIVSLAGSNDLSAGTSTDEFIARLKTIRDHARDAGVPVSFVSTAPKDLSSSEQQTLKSWAERMKADFSSCWVPGEKGDYSPCFIDIFGLLANDSLGVGSEYSAGDGIHLNDAGHEVIFEAARSVVDPYVCSRVACR